MSNFETYNLEEVRKAVNVCTMCGFCKSVCPSFKAIGWDTALSRGRIVMSYGLLNGELQPDDALIKNMYTCTDDILYGLGTGYVGGGEMTENIEKMGGKGTAQFYF